MPFFPSRYPVMCAVMNGVSDLDLALAVEAAGAMPSLLPNYRSQDNQFFLDEADRMVREYRTSTGHNGVVLSVHPEDMIEPDLVPWLDSVRPSHIELLGHSLTKPGQYADPRWPILMSRIRKYAKVMIRCTQPMAPAHWADAFCVKGRESAGCSSQSSVKDTTKKQLSDWPDCAVIPYGGIGTAEQVKEYMDIGAAAVACGSVFAASQESRLSNKVKQKIVAADLGDLVTFPDTGQRALPLAPLDHVLNDRSHWNREQSLKDGITGDGTVGHIYLGESVQYITRIRSVRDIVEDLVQLL